MSSFTAIILGLMTNAFNSVAEFAPTDPVSVTVTAQHGDGTVIPDLWLTLIPDDIDTPEVVAKTNENGVAHLVLEPRAESIYLFVKLAGLGSASHAPINDRRAVRSQDSLIIPNYSFPTFLTIALEEGVTEYATTLTLHESVRVSVQLVDELGEPIDGGVLVQVSGIGMDHDSNVEESDPLSIGGIRKGGSADMLIMGPTSPKWKIIHLEPHQTLENVDLGPIHIPIYHPGSIPLNLTVTGNNQLTTRAVEWVQGGVTIFSVDGESAIIFTNNPVTGGMVFDSPPNNEEPRTPMLNPGVYYIAPGSLGTTRADLLRRLLLDGVDVDAAGVPKITAVEGQPVTMTVDMAAAEQAILAAAGR